MLKEYIKALILIFSAELGDKSQIIAMVFAIQYPLQTVLGGILIGTFLNHSIAIILGIFISKIIPISTLSLVAGFIFVYFGLSALKIDNAEESIQKKQNYSPMLTVATVFFISELGDKTQLATIALASEATFPLVILLGTISGMLLTSLVGIIIGKKLGKNVPEFTIKVFSSTIFIGFGLHKIFTRITIKNAPVLSVAIILFTLTVFFILLHRQLLWRKTNIISKYKKISLDLHTYQKEISSTVDMVCLTPAKCDVCDQRACLIGQVKSMIQTHNIIELNKTFDNKFEDHELAKLLAKVLLFLAYGQNSDDYEVYDTIRKKIELALFTRTLVFNTLETYIEQLKTLNTQHAEIIIKQLNKEIDKQ